MSKLFKSILAILFVSGIVLVMAQPAPEDAAAGKGCKAGACEMPKEGTGGCGKGAAMRKQGGGCAKQEGEQTQARRRGWGIFSWGKGNEKAEEGCEAKKAGAKKGCGDCEAKKAGAKKGCGDCETKKAGKQGCGDCEAKKAGKQGCGDCEAKKAGKQGCGDCEAKKAGAKKGCAGCEGKKAGACKARAAEILPPVRIDAPATPAE